MQLRQSTCPEAVESLNSAKHSQMLEHLPLESKIYGLQKMALLGFITLKCFLPLTFKNKAKLAAIQKSVIHGITVILTS